MFTIYQYLETKINHMFIKVKNFFYKVAEDDEVFRSLSFLPSVWRVNVSVERNTAMETLSPENPIGNVTYSYFCT